MKINKNNILLSLVLLMSVRGDDLTTKGSFVSTSIPTQTKLIEEKIENVNYNELSEDKKKEILKNIDTMLKAIESHKKFKQQFDALSTEQILDALKNNQKISNKNLYPEGIKVIDTVEPNILKQLDEKGILKDLIENIIKDMDNEVSLIQKRNKEYYEKSKNSKLIDSFEIENIEAQIEQLNQMTTNDIAQQLLDEIRERIQNYAKIDWKNLFEKNKLGVITHSLVAKLSKQQENNLDDIANATEKELKGYKDVLFENNEEIETRYNLMKEYFDYLNSLNFFRSEQRLQNGSFNEAYGSVNGEDAQRFFLHELVHNGNTGVSAALNYIQKVLIPGQANDGSARRIRKIYESLSENYDTGAPLVNESKLEHVKQVYDFIDKNYNQEDSSVG